MYPVRKRSWRTIATVKSTFHRPARVACRRCTPSEQRNLGSRDYVFHPAIRARRHAGQGTCRELNQWGHGDGSSTVNDARRINVRGTLAAKVVDPLPSLFADALLGAARVLGSVAAELGLQLHKVGKDVGLASQFVGDHRRVARHRGNDSDPDAAALDRFHE